MAKYAVLIYLPAPGDVADTPQEELDAHARFGEEVERLGGRILDGQALQATTTATSIRGDVITDGPFVESKEVLGGFFLLEARDLDHALAIARRNPATWRAGVEVRPLLYPPAD
jgi:hypothetical protein